MAVPFWDALFAFIQFFMVLATWSYLYKDNVFSRISAQIVISVSTVHYFMWNMKRVYEMAVVPLTTQGEFLFIVPILLGALLFFRLWRTYSWVASYSYAIMLGLGTGAVLTTLVEGSIVGRIVTAVTAPFDYGASGVLLLIGVILSMTYWIFTKEAKGTLGYAIRVGRYFLMVSIGLLYAEDVLWSQSLFVGAMEMVINKFIKAVLLGMPI